TDGTDDIGQGSNNKTEQTFSFVDEAGDDFHLVLTDVGAKNSGTDLSADANISFSHDIENEIRSDAYDIGADEEMTVIWDGSESSDWATGANWAGGAAPTPDSDVIIDGNYTNAPTLNLTSGLTTINFLSLGANNASVLTLSNGNSTTKKLVVIEDVNIGATGTLTHTANTTAQTHVINMEAANLTIQNSGTINIDYKGYQTDEGPGAGIFTLMGTGGSGGAGHGGDGGDGTETDGSLAYGSITQPITIGSGGGKHASYPGGAGGGAVKLTVSGTTSLLGSITAKGQNPLTYGSGGSGGSVYIRTGTLSGSGSILANGGTSPHADMGGGGGGRIAIYYTTDSSTVTYQAYGGKNSTSSSRMGGAGTIYLKDNTAGTDELVIDNNNQYSLADNYVGKTCLDNQAYTFDTLTISNYGHLDVTAATNITYTTLDWSTKGTITDNGGTFALLSGGGDLTVSETSRLYGYTARPHTSYTLNGYMEVRNAITTTGNFDIGEAGILTHEANTTTQQYVIDITAANLTIALGGTINADYKGYQQSAGPGAGVDNSGATAGAGHGGDGGNRSTTNGGLAYGSTTQPTAIGSGGGRHSGYTSGVGGGAVKLTISGTTTLSGSIRTNGQNYPSTYGTGGSGGSIYITTEILLGNGSISVNGGASAHVSLGGGGGGRI
ncbi:MAG: hypothetical protein KAI72_01460, partial [Candidatus Pacebacteria bacterium]|nr:hypothetical protein [Candidatus Paceibacterota bacterium]